MADTAAKEATGWRSDGSKGRRADLPAELYSLKAALKGWTRRGQEPKPRNTENPAGRTKRKAEQHLDTPEPTRKVFQLHKDLRQIGILVQLCTEK